MYLQVSYRRLILIDGLRLALAHVHSSRQHREALLVARRSIRYLTCNLLFDHRLFKGVDVYLGMPLLSGFPTASFGVGPAHMVVGEGKQLETSGAPLVE